VQQLQRKVEIEVQKTFEILLDVEKELYTPSNLLFNVSRNDFESVELLFTITQDAAPLDLTGKNVELAIKKPSGLTVYQSIEITDAPDGNAAVMLSVQAYVEFGVHAAEVIVRNESQIMVTCPFYFYSREAIMETEEIESVNDWSALQQVLFSMDKKPILVDGIPTSVPEYVGQMAFDIGVNKRAFIANDLTETGWQLLGAGEGGGGIVDWGSILGKPAAFPPEIHTHDFVDIQAKPAAYPPEVHNHAILDVTGLQDALDAKANTGELGAPVDHTHEIADVTNLQTALDGKADDADLIPFILESEADVKYALKSEIDGGGGGAWGEITGTISAQTDLQTALNGKADDADLAGKAALNHTHIIGNVTGLQTALDGKADDADLTGKANAVHSHAILDVTGLQAGLDAKADDAHNHAVADVTGLQAVLDGKADDADLIPFISEAEADIKYELKGQGATGASWGEITGTISAQTDLQTALNGKADDADLAGKANTADVYTKLETYNKDEVDTIVTGITEGGGTIVQDNLISTSATAALSANQGRLLNEAKADINHNHDADYAPIIHNHAIANVTGLQTALDGKADDADLTGKADLVHTHTIANVTGLQGALDGKADDADLTGKADLVHSHTFAQITEKPAAYPAEAHNHAILDVTGLQGALDGKADDADLTGKADLVHTHTIANVTGLQTALDGKADDADLAAFITESAADLKYEPIGAGGGGGAWGEITGTISAQTDLQAALDGKADDADLTGKANAAHTHTEADITFATKNAKTYVDDADNYISGTILQGKKIWTGTQAEYDAIGTKDPATIYYTSGGTEGTGGNGVWTGSQTDYDAIATKNPTTLYFITA
jgi:hypothetical protein